MFGHSGSANNFVRTDHPSGYKYRAAVLMRPQPKYVVYTLCGAYSQLPLSRRLEHSIANPLTPNPACIGHIMDQTGGLIVCKNTSGKEMINKWNMRFLNHDLVDRGRRNDRTMTVEVGNVLYVPRIQVKWNKAFWHSIGIDWVINTVTYVEEKVESSPFCDNSNITDAYPPLIVFYWNSH
jgi:hypothetical protein